ncbi:MAG: hypothetical protein GC151_00830 [Betaproteobacteria bacterium]|nr:hypothetical protein [Betaproteobacteria bacterium]
MTRLFCFVLALVWCVTARAAVVNVEFNFTPFVGDSVSNEVESFPGTARVYVNNVLLGERDVSRRPLPILPDSGEVRPAIWIPATAVGPVLRRGHNTLRIDFEPKDPGTTYHAQLRWASVTDARPSTDAGGGARTNLANPGTDDRVIKGKVSFTHEFDAEFAPDQPWHHYPPVASVTEEDRRSLLELVKARARTFAPDFSDLYALLVAGHRVDVDEVRKSGCLETVYDAGLRIAPADARDFDVGFTGNAEVILRSRNGGLFHPEDPTVFSRVTDTAVQKCAGLVLFASFPPRLAAVRSPDGGWRIVY